MGSAIVCGRLVYTLVALQIMQMMGAAIVAAAVSSWMVFITSILPHKFGSASGSEAIHLCCVDSLLLVLSNLKAYCNADFILDSV